MSDRERFFRPARAEEAKGGEKFQRLLKKVFRAALQLLVFSFFLFLAHRVYGLMLDAPFFQVREVQVEGCETVPRETFLSLIRMEGMPNLFTVRLKDVAQAVEAHPWVEEVGARKIFPGKIVIRVKERKPIAILQLEDLYYIDAKGVIFSRVGDRDGYNYPFLTGLTRDVVERNSPESKDLLMKALELLRIVDQDKIAPLREISEIHMGKSSGIQCFTKAEGMEVRMGWDEFREKLRRVSLIWSDLEKREVAPASIDCTDPRKIVVKQAPTKRAAVRR
jgi:cell division protein FtsQ